MCKGAHILPGGEMVSLSVQDALGFLVGFPHTTLVTLALGSIMMQGNGNAVLPKT